MNSNNKINHLNKDGFRVPDNYFEHFDDDLFKKITFEHNLQSAHETGFKTPENYFEQLDEKLLNTFQKQQKIKVIKLWSRKNIAYASSIAAAVLLLFMMVFNTQKTLNFETLEIANIQNYIETTDFTTYDIASIFTDDELNTELISEETISNQTLETYLMERTNFEELLID